MDRVIVTDSSANLLSLPGVRFACVPLKIVTAEAEYTDDGALDVDAMVAELAAYKGRSGSSCPNIQDWLDAFGGSEEVFAVTITSALSGAWASAAQAGEEYVRLHPGARVHVLDSLSTGPEMQLLAEKLRELTIRGAGFDETAAASGEYRRRTHLLFCLESMKNLARNGRVSHPAAALAGVLGIRVVGAASREGTLELLRKCRGQRSALDAILRSMTERGYAGGRVRIAHCQDREGADMLRFMVLDAWRSADVQIVPTRGLCSFYAEAGGLLVGFES